MPNEGGFEDEDRPAPKTWEFHSLFFTRRFFFLAPWQVRVLSRFRHPNLVILMGFARLDRGFEPGLLTAPKITTLIANGSKPGTCKNA